MADCASQPTSRPSEFQPLHGRASPGATFRAHGAEGTARANVNLAEVTAIVAHLAELLLERGYDGSVGVISPFRPQVVALEEAIASRIPESRRGAAELRVGTVDGFQGQERDLILFSPVVHGRVARASAPAPATSQSAPAQPAMRDAPAAAEQACIALVNQNNGDSSAYVVSSEFSQANSVVMLRDGRGDTNWRCLVSNDGVVADLSASAG